MYIIHNYFPTLPPGGSGKVSIYNMKEIKKCLWCNTELIGKKLDAIYCNNKCSYLKRKSDNPNINYKIYTLNHPITNEIRYVGQTCKTLEVRLKGHIASKDKSHRVNWIKALANNNLIPKIVLLKKDLSKDECDVLEKYYIKEYKESGIRLLNLTEGGEGSYGYKHTEESKKKMSSIRKNFLDDKQCEILRQQGLKQWEMTSDEEKLNNILNQKGRRNVYQYDLDGNQINEFLSVRQIERDLGYFRASISSCLKGIVKNTQMKV